MQRFLDDHFSVLLASRADQSWKPEFFGHESVVAAYPTIAGYPMRVDVNVAVGTIELRGAESGRLMAAYEGVKLA